MYISFFLDVLDKHFRNSGGSISPQLKEEYGKIAEQNMKGGVTLSSNEQKVDTNKQVAKDLEISKETLRKSRFIKDNGDEEMIKKV